MLSASGYQTKQALKESIGKLFNYEETSAFGPEFKPGRSIAVVGPSPYKRKWFATVTTNEQGIIIKVS